MATINPAVGASANDAKWGLFYGGADYTNDSADLWIGNRLDGQREDYGIVLRFTSVAIPQGATIDAAYITLRGEETDSTSGLIATIWAADADNQAMPADYDACEALTRTTAVASWTNPAVTSGSNINTPSIATIIKEVVDRAGWASGNALVVCIENNQSSDGVYRSFHSYDSNASYAPILHVEYTEGGGTSTPMTLTGGATPSGTITKSIGQTKAGSVTPSGTIARVLNLARGYAGGVTPTGAAIKAIGQTKTGAVTSSGVITKAIRQTKTGGLTPSGTLARVLNIVRIFTGAVSSGGTMVKSIVRSFAGAVTSAGAYVGNLVTAGLTEMTFYGAVAMAGIQTRVLNLARTLTGAITPTGTAIKSITRTLTGAVTMAGATVKQLARAFAGGVTSAGTLGRQIGKTMAGAVSFAGTFARQVTITRIFTGAVSLAGSLVASLVGLYTAIVNLTLHPRGFDLTLDERNNDLTLHGRSNALTMEDR